MSATFVPYSQRAPRTDDPNVLRAELARVREEHGQRSSEAQEAFERLFRASCRNGNPLDGLRQYSHDEAERFFAQVVAGPDGHAYWTGGSQGFALNERRANNRDRKTKTPRRWWYERTNGEALSTYTDVVPTCGDKHCIAPGHMAAGRDRVRRRYTDLQMIGLLQTVTMRIGHPPTAAEWQEMRCHPTHSIYKMRFGSWPDAIRAAGYADYEPRRGMRATPERALASMREAKRLLGHWPNGEQIRRGDVHAHLKAAGMLLSPNVIRKLIGPSWSDVIAYCARTERDARAQ